MLLGSAGAAAAAPAPGTDAAGDRAAAVEPLARNGVCEVGEFCLYFGSNLSGSVSDFTGSIPDYGPSQPTCYEFKGPGAGQGQCVKNNAASASNKTTANNVTVYVNSNYGGQGDLFVPGEQGNLIAALKNNNASHRFVHI
jgi:hypothetical protein